jgi:hypothetical protein
MIAMDAEEKAGLVPALEPCAPADAAPGSAAKAEKRHSKKKKSSSSPATPPALGVLEKLQLGSPARRKWAVGGVSAVALLAVGSVLWNSWGATSDDGASEVETGDQAVAHNPSAESEFTSFTPGEPNPGFPPADESLAAGSGPNQHAIHYEVAASGPDARALQPVQFLQVGNSGPRGAWLAGTIEDDLDVSSQRTPYDSFGPRAQ